MKRLYIIFFLFIPGNLIFAQINNAEIFDFETLIQIDKDQVMKEYISIVVQINNRSGEDMTQISVPYSKNNPPVNLIAQIEDINGNIIRKLKKKDIIEKSNISDISLFEDDYIKTFTLKHNIYPYRIRYSYYIKNDEYLFITDWNPVIYSEYPTKKAKLTVKIPEDYNIKIKQNNISGPVINNVNGIKILNWEDKYTGPSKKEIYAPPTNTSLPNVKIIPENFIYSIEGSHKNWTEYGNWKYNLINGLDELTYDEQEKIDGLLKGVISEQEKISILYKYLQENTRYINVSIETGGMKPYPASYVCKNKYGDCKALTNYMKSLLKYVGIESYYSSIFAGENFRRIDFDFPSSQFNHVILFIPSNNDTIWLECTSDGYPPGYLGTFTQDRYALVVDKGKSKLIKTPELKVEDTEELRTVHYSFEKDNNTSVKINLHTKGNRYETLSSFDKTLSTDEQNKYIYYLIPLKNYELINWSISKTNNNDPVIDLNAELILKNYLKTYDNLKYASLFPTDIPDFEKPNKRKHKVRINFPVNIKDSLIYESVEGYKFDKRNDTLLETNYGTYFIKSKIEPDKVTITKQFILHAGEYNLDEYPEFYKFISSAKNLERKNPIVLTKK